MSRGLDQPAAVARAAHTRAYERRLAVEGGRGRGLRALLHGLWVRCTYFVSLALASYSVSTASVAGVTV